MLTLTMLFRQHGSRCHGSAEISLGSESTSESDDDAFLRRWARSKMLSQNNLETEFGNLENNLFDYVNYINSIIRCVCIYIYMYVCMYVM